VRLPDGQPGVVLRWICENLHLAPKGQVERIKRTEVIASDLVYVQVQTEGGFQTMSTLVLHAVPYWLGTIDTRRMKKDDPKRSEILHYQRKVVDVLYAWAQSPKAIATPTNLVPAEPITNPHLQQMMRRSKTGASTTVRWCYGLIGSMISRYGKELLRAAWSMWRQCLA